MRYLIPFPIAFPTLFLIPFLFAGGVLALLSFIPVLRSGWLLAALVHPLRWRLPALPGIRAARLGRGWA